VKVKHAQDNVKGSAGLEQTQAYTIQANAHAFKVLSSGLYSDKVRAVLREIGCNAADAHIEAGIADRPFHVKLPNALDDQFFVKDWGPGMAHDEVMRLYTSYFTSTKQQSNDMTGAFGLGSKSPFSYVDSYTVVSVSGGRKRTYALYLDNHGLPTVSLMAEEEPDKDWQSGVLVSFAVRPGDYEEFLEKAQEVFQWFSVPPRITGAKTKIEPLARLRTCDDFMVTEKLHSHCVVMGNVRYPVDWSKLSPKGASKLLWEGRNITLKAKIGDLDIVASRENLEYTEHTLRSLRAIARRTVEKIGSEIGELVLEAKREGWSVLCQVGDSVKLAEHVGWHNRLREVALLAGYDNAQAEFIHLVASESGAPMPQVAGSKCAVTLAQKNSSYRGGVRQLSITNGEGSFNYRPRVSYTEKSVIARGTGVKHVRARLRHAISSGDYDQIICVADSQSKRASLREVVDESSRISAALYDMPIVDLGSLGLPPSFVPSKRGKGFTRVKTLPDTPANVLDVISHTSRNQMYNMSQVPSLAKMNPRDRVFMAKVTTSAWGRTSLHYRWMLQGKNGNADRRMREYEWQSTWERYCEIVNKLDLRTLPQQVVICTPQDIKSWRLVQNGFKSFPELVQELASSPDVRDGVRAVANGVFPSLPHNRGWGLDDEGWAVAIGVVLADKEIDPKILEELDRVGASDSARKLVDAGDSGHKIATLLDNYQSLCRTFNAQAQVVSTDDPLTTGDLDTAFVNRFPRAAPFNAGTVMRLLKRADALDFVKWILEEDKGP
jgi:hypothetical protein